MFCKKKQEFTAGGLVEQHVYEAVGSINDIDQQPLHFVVVQARYVVPGNEAVWTADRHIRVVPGRGRWRDACMKILQHRIAKAVQDHVLRKPLL